MVVVFALVALSAVSSVPHHPHRQGKFAYEVDQKHGGHGHDGKALIERVDSYDKSTPLLVGHDGSYADGHGHGVGLGYGPNY